MKSIKGTVAEQMEASVLYQSFLRDFNSHFLFCGQIENKSNFLPDQTVKTRKNSIKNKNGVINKKEAVRMLLDDYSSILQQPLY